jgi:hypothetical protein
VFEPMKRNPNFTGDNRQRVNRPIVRFCPLCGSPAEAVEMVSNYADDEEMHGLREAWDVRCSAPGTVCETRIRHWDSVSVGTSTAFDRLDRGPRKDFHGKETN